MAAGWLRHLAGNAVVVWSGGSEPTYEISPGAIAAMAEVRIDITDEFPKPWHDDIVRADGRGHHHGLRRCLSGVPGEALRNWKLDDPAGMGFEWVRPSGKRSEVMSKGLWHPWESSYPAE